MSDNTEKLMMQLLEEIDSVLPLVENWKPEMDQNMPETARAFIGTHGNWRFVIVDFNIEDQGFPSGSRGYDGAATNLSKNVVIHLTRDLAKKALDLLLPKITQ